MLHITDSQHSIEAIKQKLITLKLCSTHDSKEQITFLLAGFILIIIFLETPVFTRFKNKSLSDYICITNNVILVSPL